MPRSTQRLAIVFGVLLIVTLAFNVFERRATTSRTREFARIDAEDVTRIEVRGQDGQEVALVREGDRWIMADPVNWPADQDAVATMLEKAAELSVTNIVSSNPSNHDRYEVGPDTGILVRLLGGRDGDRRLSTFYIGAVTPDINGTYIREFGSDDTWAANGLLRGYFNKTVGAWRDRTIFALDPASVTSIQVQSPDAEWTLHRRGSIVGAPDAAWVVAAEGEVFPADSTRAAAVVRTAATLRATDFPSGSSADDADWENPVKSALMTLADGSMAAFSVAEVPGDEARYYLRKEGAEQVFIIYRSTLDTVFRPLDQVKATG